MVVDVWCGGGAAPPLAVGLAVCGGGVIEAGVGVELLVLLALLGFVKAIGVVAFDTEEVDDDGGVVGGLCNWIG